MVEIKISKQTNDEKSGATNWSDSDEEESLVMKKKQSAVSN
jgi:hypothetical protein